LAASTTPGHYLVPALLGSFRERHSGVTAELWIGDTASAARRVAERGADLGFVGSPPDLADLAGQPFADDEIVLVASPRHPLASAGVVRPADLAREPFVVREPGSATMQAAAAALARLDLSPPAAMVFGSDEALKAAIAAGLGIGALSRHAIAAELAAGLLTILPVAGWSCERQLWCIWRRGHAFRRVELAFLRFVGVTPPRLR
jgi:DNA-binding transcriptional LysR family regulator